MQQYRARSQGLHRLIEPRRQRTYVRNTQTIQTFAETRKEGKIRSKTPKEDKYETFPKPLMEKRKPYQFYRTIHAGKKNHNEHHQKRNIMTLHQQNNHPMAMSSNQQKTWKSVTGKWIAHEISRTFSPQSMLAIKSLLLESSTQAVLRS